MKNLIEFSDQIEILFTDIDDTLTDHGHLGAQAYTALWELHEAGYKIVPVTGRPAGWCEMIARLWPVSGVIGENGGFYFRYDKGKMHRKFAIDDKQMSINRQKLNELQNKVLKEVPGCDLASDQFCRIMDIAIDFCEDVPRLSDSEINKICQIFIQNGAQAKVSSIHVNAWFGTYDKLKMSLDFLNSEFKVTPDQAKNICAFCGDSPNDEPMFAFFPNSFAVANIKKFVKNLQHPPQYIIDQDGGLGFSKLAKHLLNINRHNK